MTTKRNDITSQT